MLTLWPIFATVFLAELGTNPARDAFVRSWPARQQTWRACRIFFGAHALQPARRPSGCTTFSLRFAVGAETHCGGGVCCYRDRGLARCPRDLASGEATEWILNFRIAKSARYSSAACD